MSFIVNECSNAMNRHQIRFIQASIENAASLQGLRAISFNYEVKGIKHYINYNVAPFDDFSIGSKVEIGFTDESCWAWLNHAINHKFDKTKFKKI